MIKEKQMITKRGGESTSDVCMLAFRKRTSPITEESFRPDRDLACEMVERKIRVQDLLNLLGQNSIVGPNNIMELLKWWQSGTRCGECSCLIENMSGRQSYCKDCATVRGRAQSKAYYEAHKEEIKIKNALR